MLKELKLIEQYRDMNSRINILDDHISCDMLIIINDFLDMIKEKQLIHLIFMHVKELLDVD